MAKFRFNIDRKCTIWVREYHEVDATTYEEAEKIIVKGFGDDETCSTFVAQEMLDDTCMDMDIEDNYWQPTAEILNEDGHTIIDNAINFRIA